MYVAGEVHQEGQFLRFGPSTVGTMLFQVDQVLAHLGDDAIPLRTAGRDLGRAFEQADIDVVPGCSRALAALHMIGPDSGARHGFGERIGRARWRSARCSKGSVLFQEARHGLAGAFGQMRRGYARDGLVPLVAPTPRLAWGK